MSRVPTTFGRLAGVEPALSLIRQVRDGTHGMVIQRTSLLSGCVSIAPQTARNTIQARLRSLSQAVTVAIRPC